MARGQQISVCRYEALKMKSEWDKFAISAKNGHFMFQRDYMDYHSDRFTDFSLMVYMGERLVALLPANVKAGVVYSHQGLTFGGFITDAKMRISIMLEIIGAVSDYLFKSKVRKLVYKRLPYIYHSMPSGEDAYALYRYGATRFRMDLSTTIMIPADLEFSSGKRNGINRCLKNGVSVQSTEDYTSFFEMVHRRLQQKYDTLPTHTAAEMLNLADRFPNNIKLFGAYLEGTLVAGVLVYITKHVVHTQYISSTDVGRKFRAVDFIIGHLVREIFCDVKYFDFGISNEDDGRIFNQNLATQKEEFGGRAICHEFYELDVTTTSETSPST